MKTLYITDLDGTLLNKQGKISEFTLKTINNLIKNGMNFTYATARSLSSALPVTQELNIKLPLILYNGTFIVDSQTHKILYKNNFTKTQINTIKQIMQDNKVNPMVYALINDKEKVTIINDSLNEGTKVYLDKRKNDQRINLITDLKKLYLGEIYYFTIIGEYEKLKPIYDQLLQYDEDYNITFQQEIYRTEYWLEIMPKMASKAKAILKLKEIMGYDRIIVFGDAINDLEMFKISDECYAMKNAVKELKKKATAIIKSNENDGVADWLINNY